MIGDQVLSIVFWFLGVIINLLPNSSGFPPQVIAGATMIGGYTQIFSPLVDFGTLATVVGLAFSVEIGIFGFKTLKWVLSHIPFIGGHG
jgi:Mg2+/citrate symporter